MMKKNIRWILVALWMLLIFCLSGQPAIDSKALSSDTAIWIVQFLEQLCPCFDMQATDIHSPLRKIAHFFLYFVLGLLFTWSMHIEKGNRNKKVMVAIAFCFFYALTDECHQAFVPGRGAQWSDVLLDSIGGLCGIASMYLSKQNPLCKRKNG